MGVSGAGARKTALDGGGRPNYWSMGQEPQHQTKPEGEGQHPLGSCDPALNDSHRTRK